jgi:hypothetical protein
MFSKINSDQNIFISIVLGIIFTTIIALLIYKQIIYPTIIPMVNNRVLSLFADWTVILNANICLEKGFDVFLENPCDQWKRKHVYGDILLHIPYIKTFPKFYFLYLPIIFGFLFLTIISNFLFVLSDKKYWVVSLFFVFSVPTILVIERSNIDLLIFLILFLVSKNYSLILNYLLIILSTITKFYPIVFTAIFFFNKKIFLKILILISISFLILFLQKESLIKIFENQSQFSASGIYSFSLISFLKIFSIFKISFGNHDYTWLKYFYLLIFVIFPIFLLNFKNYPNVKSFTSNMTFDETSTFQQRFFILSSIAISFCYFVFTNFVYREIFFLGLIPYLLNNKSINNNFFSKFLYFFLVIKFLLTTIFIIIFQNDFFEILNPFLILFKHTIDVCLMSLILNIIIFTSLQFMKNKLSQVPQ